jgi:type IV secretory pathway TraG/TraD family ATPase VirD4
LEAIVKFIKLTKEPITIPNIFKYLDLDFFRAQKDEHKKKYHQELTEEERKISDEIYYTLKGFNRDEIGGVSDAIHNLYSPLRKVLTEQNTLLELTKKYKRIIFSLNSLKNAVRAKMIGQLIVQDLKEFATIKDPNLIINVFLDELNVFISSDLINLINKTRAYKFRNFLSFQTIGDLKIKEGDQKDIIFGNVANIIAHETPSVETQEYISKLFGTKEVIESTNQMDYEKGYGTKGSKKVIDEFIVDPNQLSRLKRGECFFKTTLPSGTKFIKKVSVVRSSTL